IPSLWRVAYRRRANRGGINKWFAVPAGGLTSVGPAHSPRKQPRTGVCCFGRTWGSPTCCAPEFDAPRHLPNLTLGKRQSAAALLCGPRQRTRGGLTRALCLAASAFDLIQCGEPQFSSACRGRQISLWGISATRRTPRRRATKEQTRTLGRVQKQRCQGTWRRPLHRRVAEPSCALPTFLQNIHRGAPYVDRILRGKLCDRPRY